MNIDLDEYREQSLETWDEMAAGWEARAAWMSEATGVVNEWILDKVDPQPRETVLDIAAGPGDLGLRIAPRVGDGGRVLSTDFAPEMVAVARRIGDGRGLTNVEYRVLDAERMDLDDESVDSAVCRWGYMLMADPGRALSETKRVLHSGGPLAFAVWAAPERNPWAAVPAKTLVERGHMPAPEPGAPGIFAMADPERIRSLVSGAGFGEPVLEEIPFEFRYKDFDDLWDSVVRLAGPLAHAIKALDGGERRATYEAIEQNVAPFRQEDGSYLAPALCIGGLAR
jgi:ubiquinone/menaquinone biosynthesis C-methylase UbiE